MRNNNQKCEELIKRWKYLKEKLPKAINPGEISKTSSNITAKELKEYGEVIENIRDNCINLLSPPDRYEIYERTERSKKNETEENTPI